jgi:hypothetical protein
LAALLAGSIMLWNSASSTADENRELADRRLAEIDDLETELDRAAKATTDLQTELEDAATAATKAGIELSTAQEERDAAEAAVAERVEPMSAIEVRGHAQIMLDIWEDWNTRTSWTMADLIETEDVINDELDRLGVGGALDEDAGCVATLSVSYGDMKAFLVPLFASAVEGQEMSAEYRDLVSASAGSVAEFIPEVCGL